MGAEWRRTEEREWQRTVWEVPTKSNEARNLNRETSAFHSLLANIQAGHLDSDTNWGLWRTSAHCCALFSCKRTPAPVLPYEPFCSQLLSGSWSECVKTLRVSTWKTNGIISNYSQCCGIIWLIWVEWFTQRDSLNCIPYFWNISSANMTGIL